jgi:hypothetical protein
MHARRSNLLQLLAGQFIVAEGEAPTTAVHDAAVLTQHPQVGVKNAVMRVPAVGALELARAVEFGLYDWPDVLELLRDAGPDALIRQVRGAEASDPDATRWPRNKISDDATAAYCSGF